MVDSDTAWHRIEESLRSPDPIPWWPALRATGASDGVRMTVRSVFGYRVRAHAHDIVERRTRLEFRLAGDIAGQGSIERGDGLVIRMDVRLTKRWMAVLHPVLRPAFVLAHDAVMRRGCRRFNRWLAEGARPH